MTTMKHISGASAEATETLAKRALPLLVACMTMVAPTLSSAGKPAPEPAPECAIFLSPDRDQINFTDPNTAPALKLVRIPGYPGAWRGPEIKIVGTITPTGSSAMDPFIIKDERIPYFYVTYVEAGLNLNLEALGITADTFSTGTIDIEATVTETLVSKNKKKTVDQVTKCSLKEVPVYY